MWADRQLTWRKYLLSYVKYLGSKPYVCYQPPWQPLEIAINQRCFTYLGMLLSPVLQEDLWRIQEKSAPAPAADPVASASTRLCKLSYYPSQPETTHSSTLYPTISLYHGLLTPLCIISSLFCICIQHQSVYVCVAYLCPTAIVPSCSMFQCHNAYWLLPIAAW